MAEEIQAISKIGGMSRKALDTIKQKPTQFANKEQFDKLMAQDTKVQNQQVTKTEPSDKSSIIDQVRDLHNKSDGWKISMHNDDLIAQARDAVSKMEEIKGKLNTPELQFKAPVQRLLNNKLNHVNENLQIALNKAGIEYQNIEAPGTGKTNPIERFFGLLSDGQHKLETLSSNLSMMKEGEVSPTKMLAIQIKVGFAQQEIELFSSMLNKALESTKTVMNVQV